MVREAAGGNGGSSDDSEEEDVKDWTSDDDSRHKRKGRAPAVNYADAQDDDSTVAERKAQEAQKLQERKKEIQGRLDMLGVGKPSGKGSAVPEFKGQWAEVCKEAIWLGKDFKDERDTHRQKRGKICRSVMTHWRSQGTKEERQAREQEAQLRKQAARVAREVKSFWMKINKLVSFRQKVEVDEARKKAMDKHLAFLVQQTERYAGLVAKNMMGDRPEPLGPGSAVKDKEAEKKKKRRRRSTTPSKAGSSSGKSDDAFWSDHEDGGEGGDTDFSPDEGEADNEEEDEDDDELAQQEEEERPRYREEVKALNEEASMPLEELKKLYSGPPPSGPSTNGTSSKGEASGAAEPMEVDEEDDGEEEEEEDEDEEDGSDAYEAEEEEDDERSIAEQEERERNGYEEEVEALQRECEMSVDELRKLYYGEGAEDGEGDEDGDKKPAAASSASASSTSGAADSKGKAPLPKQQQAEEEQEEEEQDGDDDEEEEDDGDESEEGDYAGSGAEDEEEGLSEQEDLERAGYTEEMAALQDEANMTVEQLRALYYGGAHVKDEEDEEEEDSKPAASSSSSSGQAGKGKEKARVEVQAEEEEEEDEEEEDGSDAYEAEEEEDDERSIAEQEERERNGYEEEVEALQRECGMSVDELRKLYHGEGAEDDEAGEKSEAAEDGDESGSGEEEEEDEASAMDVSEAEGEEDDDDDEAKLARMQEIDDKVRSIAVERPFLLSPQLKLREYQQAGLNWLVSLYERRLNGILADEMGLGKTIQTIALLAFLASQRGIWGPHLVVVPTSCIVNWESEFKRWCPGFKILTYYGSAVFRKFLRQGWSKPNAFHVVITSYQLVVQDASSFKRKKWFFLILDEAHNIKNFKSQRWQTLLNFNSHRRLLLTGTPLQNDLMELWSLMHFLMPHVFRSRKEFSYWFSNPLNNMVEGTRAVNEGLIRRLHTIVRPFLLRRLKRDVEKQLPGKFEHTVMCPLSRRQLQLYEEFMSRSTTRAALAGGNFMGMMNVLMQLRKVCNHPDLFEPRPIVSPYSMGPVLYKPPTTAVRALAASPLHDLSSQLLQPLWPALASPAALLHTRALRTPSEMIIKVKPPPLLAQSQLASSDPLVHHHLLMLEQHFHAERQAQHHLMARVNERRCGASLTFSKPTSFASILSPAAFACSPASTIHIPTTTAYQAKTNNSLRLLTPRGLIDAIKSEAERADELQEALARFSFVVPSVRSSRPVLVVTGGGAAGQTLTSPEMEEQIRAVVTRYVRPFHTPAIRQTLSFPDRWLVQYDAGKLQVLAGLLRKLKRGGHRCLIFTQMTKMLDVLEFFLNLHGHSYLRLDGATGVDKRQKLMDRYNNDTKIFCFILSTRSGGLGINLTGADTVIFYDSDWNPAMDAQAQDRAHRIGQTREVHIYRLVSEKTIEENILKKARQRRQLDFLAITAGRFTPEQMYNQQTLREMLDPEGAVAPVSEVMASAKDVQDAMNAMEDEADLEAMRGAQKENIEEMREFDDSGAAAGKDEDDGDDDEDGEGDETASEKKAGKGKAGGKKAVAKKEEDGGDDGDDEEGNMGDEEFAAWSTEVGPDLNAMESRLKPVQRYALKFRTVVDPFKSLYFISEEQRRREVEEDQGDVDIEALEAEAMEEEAKSLEEGEVLATAMEDMSSEGLAKHAELYKKERARIQAQVRSRQMTGENWKRKVELQSGFPYWYNEDTGEAQWEQPKVIYEREAQISAREEGFGGLPPAVLLNVMAYLAPAPERIRASLVCKRWRTAAWSREFFKRVLPVEANLKGQESNLGKGLYLSLAKAVEEAEDGETVLLEPGHHWEDGLVLKRRVRLIGDGGDSSRVVLELSGSILWQAKGGVLQDLTIRHPRACPKATAVVAVVGGLLELVSTTINADNGGGAGLLVGGGGGASLYSCSVTNAKAAGLAVVGGAVAVCKTELSKNGHDGLVVAMGSATLIDCRVTDNQGVGVRVYDRSMVCLRHNDLTHNEDGSLRRPKKNRRGPYGVVMKGFKNLVDQANEDLSLGLVGASTYRSQTSYYDRLIDPDAPPSEQPPSRPYTRHQHNQEDGLLTSPPPARRPSPTHEAASSSSAMDQSPSLPLPAPRQHPASSSPASTPGPAYGQGKRPRDMASEASPQDLRPAKMPAPQAAYPSASSSGGYAASAYAMPDPGLLAPGMPSGYAGGGTAYYPPGYASPPGTAASSYPPTYASPGMPRGAPAPRPAAPVATAYNNSNQQQQVPYASGPAMGQPWPQQPYTPPPAPAPAPAPSKGGYFSDGLTKPKQDRVTLVNPRTGKKLSVLRTNAPSYIAKNPDYTYAHASDAPSPPPAPTGGPSAPQPPRHLGPPPQAQGGGGGAAPPNYLMAPQQQQQPPQYRPMAPQQQQQAHYHPLPPQQPSPSSLPPIYALQQAQAAALAAAHYPNNAMLLQQQQHQQQPPRGMAMMPAYGGAGGLPYDGSAQWAMMAAQQQQQQLAPQQPQAGAPPRQQQHQWAPGR